MEPSGSKVFLVEGFLFVLEMQFLIARTTNISYVEERADWVSCMFVDYFVYVKQIICSIDLKLLIISLYYLFNICLVYKDGSFSVMKLVI